MARPKKEDALVGFAKDLGTMLGHTHAKAEALLEQRHKLTAQLRGVRDTANKILERLEAQGATTARRGRAAAATMAKAAKRGRKKGLKLSAATRKKMAAGTKQRWAKMKGEANKRVRKAKGTIKKAAKAVESAAG